MTTGLRTDSASPGGMKLMNQSWSSFLWFVLTLLGVMHLTLLHITCVCTADTRSVSYHFDISVS